jgi:thymidylate synthase ThyX
MDPKKLAGVIGALMARQSRAPGTVIDVLVEEFLVTDAEEAVKLGVKLGSLREQKLDELIERILIQYGDDSVQELEYASVLFNSVSNLAAKMIEDRRLGAYIEQSSRYVLYTQKDPITDSWYYYRPEAILNSPLKSAYIETMDACFAMYADMADKLTAYYEQLKPIDEVEYAIRPNDSKKYRFAELVEKKEQALFKRTYGFDIRTRACDTARIMLPASTLTSLGMVANGRTFEHLLKVHNVLIHKIKTVYYDKTSGVMFIIITQYPMIYLFF